MNAWGGSWPGEEQGRGRRQRTRTATRVSAIVATVFASALISALTAANVAGFAALTHALLGAIGGGVLAAVLCLTLFGFLRPRRSEQSMGGRSARKLARGHLMLVLGVALLSLTWLVPAPGATRPDPVRDLEWIDRPDGSRLAVTVTRAPEATEPPMILVHGGPGVADMEHPDRIAALVLSAPGDLPLDGAASQPGDLTTHLDAVQRLRLYLRLSGPRNLFTYALTAADPGVGHRVAGDREMDRRFAAIFRDSAPALFCDDRLTSLVGTGGVGYYAHYMPQLRAAQAPRPVELRRLSAVTVPVLLIKPACDYLPWSTVGYRRAFPQARLVMIPDAGHAAYLKQHDVYLRLVEAFLAGRALPLPVLDGDTIPEDYRGTR